MAWGEHRIAPTAGGNEVLVMNAITAESKAHFSIASVIAIAAAITSLFVGAGAGFILALVAIVFGIIGVVMALSPRVRGGMVSILSLIVAAIGVVVAVARAIGSAL
jgi:hypothetical protein